MSSYSNYLNRLSESEKKKKKKKEEEEAYAKYMQSFAKKNQDIAPVKKTTTTAPTVTTSKKEDERTWFKGSKYFNDGYDFGDVTKTILGTVADIGGDIGTGIIGMGEKAVDALSMLGTAMGNTQMSQLSNDELAFSALKNIGKDKETKEKEAESIVKKYNTFQADAKKGTTEFVKKDLYDEEAIAKKIITAPFQKATGIDVEGSSVLGEKSDALVQSGGQLLATAGLQAVGVPWFLTTGLTSYGAETENAMNQGATFEQASMSAAVSAGAEILSEKLFGGIKFGGKTLDDVLIKPFTEKISSKVVRRLVDFGVDSVGEGTEEVFSSIFSNLGSALYKEESIGELLTSEEAVDEYIESFIGGAVLGGVSSGIRTVANRNKIELTENEQKVVDKVVEDRIAEEKEKGTVSKKKEAEIRKSVLNDMLKGYIDTDTIESVLGGEEYATYKRIGDARNKYETTTNDLINKLQEEYDTLYKMKNGDKSDEQIDRQAKLLEKLEKNKADLEEFNKDTRLSDLKAKLGQNVFELVKDSRLIESYREIARGKQKFVADTSKYKSENARQTVQNAIDSGYITNTNAAHEFVDFAAKLSEDKGYVFEFLKTKDIEELKKNGNEYNLEADAERINAFISDKHKKIVVNMDYKNSFDSLVGHEITHTLEQAKAYEGLHKAIESYLGKDEYSKALETFKKRYSGVNADPQKELVAEFCGTKLLTDYDFVKHLSTENRNVFQKIYDEIKYLCKIATAGSKEARQLERVKRAFEKAYKESAKAVAQETKTDLLTETDSNTRYSLVEDKETLDFLNEQEGKGVYEPDLSLNGKDLIKELRKPREGVVVVYRAAVKIDGKYYPPMATDLETNINTRQKGERKDLKRQNPTILGRWEMAEEHPEYAIQIEGKKWLSFVLNKDNGKSLTVAYNPYIHTSLTPLNDQFKSAYSRDNLVVLKGYVPLSEMTSRYHAEGAKNSTGPTTGWNSGAVSKELKKGGNPRVVLLSRYFKPVEEVSAEEIADIIVDKMLKTNKPAYPFPYNVVTPQIGKALENKGLILDERENKAFPLKSEVYTDIKYSLSTEGMSESDQETARNVINSLKTLAVSSKYVDGFASYTQDRMEREISNSSYSHIPDYAKSYITWVDTIDFVYATTTSEQYREKLKEEAGELDLDKLKNETQPIHLTVNFETGEIVGHEGRHRMLALNEKGVRKVAIIIDALNDNRSNTKPIELMALKGQKFAPYRQGTNMYLHNMLPLSQRYADTVRQLFTNKPASGIQYSLSTEQEEYFKDSKVRDENGNLKVMYHGTSKGGHTVFDTYGSNYGLMGTGSYFTDNKSVAESYTNKGKGDNKQVYESYLNITNPLDMDAQANPEEWAKAFEDVDFPESGTNEQFYRAVEEYCADDMMTKWEAADFIRESIEFGMGYDGITHIGGGRFNKKDETRHRVYIAFEPEQIKNIDNIAPTKDADIRYSLSDSEGKTLTKEQAEYFKDSQVRWGDKLMPVYHGTREEFTEFDSANATERNRQGGLLWAAKDYEYAKDYSFSDYPIVKKGYLNATNILDIGDIDSYGNYDKRLQEIANLVQLTPGELEAMVDFKHLYIYDITSSKKFKERIVELGYDGVEAQESGLQTFGFVNSNQFKNVDNLNPTSDPDIRYSLTEDSEGNKLTEKQREYFEGSQAVDRNGNLLKVYHTTKNDFTVFDKSRKGEATEDANTYLGFFFTDDAEYMQNFPEFENGKTESYYLDMKNPIDMTDISREAFMDIVEVMGGDVGDASILFDEELEAAQDRAKLRGDNNVSLQLGRLLDELTDEFYYNDFITELQPHYDELMSKGYDGVINYMDELYGVKEYIVLDSNQAKLTSNLNPTADADIRYSLTEDELQEQYKGFNDIRYNYGAVEQHKKTLAKKITVDSSIDLDTINKRYDKILAIWDRLGGELDSKFLNDWNNKTERRFTIFKAQSGYKYNAELSSMCKKGVPLFEAIDTIVKKEVMKELDTDIIGKEEKEILYDILKQHDFEIPCAICYVEQARQREGVIIDAFLNGNKEGKLGWNQVLDSIETEMSAKGITFRFPNVSRDIATDKYDAATINMDDSTAQAFYSVVQKLANQEIKRYNKAEKKNRKLLKNTTPEAIKDCFGGTLPANLKIFKTLLTEPSSRFRIENDLLYSSMATSNLSSYHHNLYSLFNSQGGVSGYKTKQGTTIYWGEILNKKWTPETTRKEGGVRGQSNSDSQAFTILDQAQMYIDYTAKGLYSQEYTKVISKLKLFGLSKAKINASLIPKVHIYRDANGNVDVQRTMENAGLDENGNLMFDDVEGINHKEAFMLIEDADYSKNICGICIGYSDNHIWKMLDDNRIQMIIGFHDKTNDPNKRYRGARYSKNYNGLNEVIDNKGKTKHINFNPYIIRAEKRFTSNAKTESFEGKTTFKGKVYAANDIPRLAADMYLDMCNKKGYTPAYKMFSTHPNYYKLLADIGLYDSQGNYAPHRKVEYNMPDTVPYLDENGNKKYMSSEAYIKSELQKELAVRDAIAEAMADTSENGIIPQFKAEIERRRNLKNSLSDGNEIFKDYGRFYGKDIVYQGEDIAPVTETATVSEMEQVAPTVDNWRDVASTIREPELDEEGTWTEDYLNYNNSVRSAVSQAAVDEVIRDIESGMPSTELKHKSIDAIQEYNNIVAKNNVKEYGNGEEAPTKIVEYTEAEELMLSTLYNQYSLYDSASRNPEKILKELKKPIDDIAPTQEYEAIEPRPVKQPKMARADKGNVEQPTAKILTEEPTANKKKNTVWSKFKSNFIDKAHPFETLALKTGNREVDAKFNSIRYSDRKAQRLIGEGAEGVKALNDIQTEVEKDGLTQALYEYLYHKHNVDRMTLADRYDDVPNKAVFGDSVTAEASQDIVNQYEFAEPKLKEYAQEIYNYNKHLRNLLVEGGVISQETADLWEEMYPHYVPIRRAGDEGLNINVALDTNRTGVNAPIKRATGGNRDILPLFDTMAQRTLQTYKAISKNRFGVELKNTLGTTIESTDTNLDEVIDSIDTQEGLLQEGKNGRNPTFTVFENGKRVTFEITDEMYDALKPTSEGLAYTNKVLNKGTNLFRGLVTEYNPTFMLTNPIKDSQDVLINSQHPAKTYKNFPKAVKELASKGKWYTEYMENGGADNTYFDKQTNTFDKEKSKLSKVIGFPLEKISQANNFIERIPRLAEYIASRESGRSIDTSMLDAARVTTNFSAGGDVTKFLNRNGATFLNASVQGAAQQVRNVREAKANGLKGWVQLATKVALAGLPSILLNNLLWDDDEEYEELSDYVKQNYYVVAKTQNGKFVRIPKGRALAVIQNAFEQVQNALTGDDEVDLSTFLKLAMSNIAPNNPLDNNIIAPILQAVNNETWYGEDLVPTRLQDLPAKEQHDESTDAISKWLGEKINISPYKINYLLNQYSGGVGDIVLPMLTPEAESGDNSLLGNFSAPLRDKFSTDSVLNNQNPSDFYNVSDELKVNANSMNATDEDVLKYKYINSVSTDIGNLYKEKREIQNSNLSDKVKFNQVRNIQKQINDITRDALNTYENVKITGKYANIGDRHYRLTDEGEWQKITDDQLEKQNEVTKGLGIDVSEHWSDKDEYDFAYEYADKYEFFNSIGFSYDEYKALDEDGKNAYTWASKNQGKYTLSKAVTDNVIEYRGYTSDLYDIRADKDANGKSISGSAKEKKKAYIWGLDIDDGAKYILFKNEYNADDTYNYEIIDYLNGRDDISYDEMNTILEELGFKVDRESGYIYWD